MRVETLGIPVEHQEGRAEEPVLGSLRVYSLLLQVVMEVAQYEYRPVLMESLELSHLKEEYPVWWIRYTCL